MCVCEGGKKMSSLHERKDVAPGGVREVKYDGSWGVIVPHLNQIRSFSGRRREKVRTLKVTEG